MAVDLLTCRYCKLTEPQTRMRRVRGKPRGECLNCTNLMAVKRRSEHKLYKDFTGLGSGLTKVNYSTLANLKRGAYPLTFKPEGVRAGYLVVRFGSVYVNIWSQEHLVSYALYPISAWLADLGLVIGSEAIPELADDGVLGVGLELEDAADKLVAFDLKLQAHAMRRVERKLEELREAQAKAFNKPPTETKS